MTFSVEETADLARIAGLMIPASDAHGVPGADDTEIMAAIMLSAARDAGSVRQAMTVFAACPDPETFQRNHQSEATCLQTIVASCYYRDARVLTSLGRAPQPPFPKGHEVNDGDWSLLDPVRARAPIWRPTE
jgi:hypothetical protein